MGWNKASVASGTGHGYGSPVIHRAGPLSLS